MPATNYPTQNVPDLTTTLAYTVPKKTASLRLISDRIAQQRQTAARAILLHPQTLILLALTLIILFQCLYKTPSDWPLLLPTATGCISAVLRLTRYATRGYLDEAERVGTWRWLYSNPTAPPPTKPPTTRTENPRKGI
ncbi:hypothetical protein BDV26DRAFT_293234 [Aspergillus bertholletiae]|uniref:Uncharacterized protein n=1 Tax=Aspergillus bertholletiae TaxID=1226010 RepID=A0A5N7B775_9EURO|nr:hypothetical protein BDV26DRAFT_293234 [Aspergillus bertholletiae]